VLPELLYIVEPDIGPRLLELLSRSEVVVEFTIRADGSVTGVQVLPPVPRQWVPVVTAAVEQWRFAPLPASRRHRVQLVFKNGS
jgi:outer membrane biosynthesis protein TonB